MLDRDERLIKLILVNSHACTFPHSDVQHVTQWRHGKQLDLWLVKSVGGQPDIITYSLFRTGITCHARVALDGIIMTRVAILDADKNQLKERCREKRYHQLCSQVLVAM